jgi:hypothetical protein
MQDTAASRNHQPEFLMQPTLPLWLQPLTPDLRRRLELAGAAAREARLNTHAQQAGDMVAVLARRMSFEHAIDRYLDVMALGADDAETVRTRTLAALGEQELSGGLNDARPRGWSLDWRYATPLGAVRYVRKRMRRSAEEDLWVELLAARAEEALARTHIRHAMTFVKILHEFAPPTRAVSLYLDQLHVPSARARMVYQRVLARVAEAELPQLRAAPDRNTLAPER